MRKVNIFDLKPGMVLGESVVNMNSGVELLAEGSVITKRHISMLEYLDLVDVSIYDEEDLNQEDNNDVDHVEVAEKIATANGHEFDKESFSKEIDAVNEEDYEKVVTSVVNQNMEIHLLTGEGNIPIDKKHEEMIADTKSVFEELKSSDNIDYKHVKESISKAIPDMIRNNDVLMRLKQLELGDDYTYHHSLRVSILASMIGKWLGYSKSSIEDIATTAMLFDIGKLKIPGFILDKPDKITAEEFEIVKKHPQFGYSVLLKTKGRVPQSTGSEHSLRWR